MSVTAETATNAAVRAAPAAGPGRPASAGRWRLAFFLAGLSLLAGILLASVSVWFLGAVALAGAGSAALTFDFHTPGALVRLFALTRTLGKYGERLSGHAAALADQVSLRLTIFAAMAGAPATRAAGWQLSREERLADWLEDVEDRDDERLRVQFPAATLAFGFALLLTATLFTAPLAGAPILVFTVAVFMLGWRAVGRIAASETALRQARRLGSSGLGAALTALVPLAAEGQRQERLGSALGDFRAAEAARRRQAEAVATLDLAAGLFGPIAVTALMIAAFHAGARGEALLPAAFVGFGWLALGEAAGAVSRMLVGRVKAKAARANLALWTDALARPAETAPVPDTAVASLGLRGVRTAAPDGRPIGRVLDLAFRPGRPTAVTGVSGSGKTTLLKTIAGWLEPAEGTVTIDGADLEPASRRRLVHLCLHDAAILADTVRANLFADGASDAELRAALEAVEMDERISAGGGLDAWITQDTLSLGEAQRLNLARAFLTEAPVILLDEPTEHLDAAQAIRILARLRRHAAYRVLVYGAHRPPLLGDAVLPL